MQGQAGNKDWKGTIQSFFICIFVCGAIVFVVAATLYFLNQDKEVMPDATPGSPIESKADPH